MGYTHYFYRPAILPVKSWKKFLEEIETLKDALPEHGITAGGSYKEHPLEIAGWNGKSWEDTEAPIYSKEDDEICFNGVGELGHESFVLERVSKEEPRKGGLVFAFCKTARKPYDTFVCLVLISFKRHFGDKVEVSSDGEIEDWMPAIELYNKVVPKHQMDFKTLMRDDEK